MRFRHYIRLSAIGHMRLLEVPAVAVPDLSRDTGELR